MEDNKKRDLTRNDLILELWEGLDCQSAGAGELQQIQSEIENRLGAGAVESPASIARILADHGATLRHPEILDLDTEWRERRQSIFSTLDFSSLSGAIEALYQLQSLRTRLQESGAKPELYRLYDYVNEVRNELSLMALNKKASPIARAEAKEISEWLSLWRTSPDLFADWLQLRVVSPGFRSLFPDFRSP